MKKFIYSLSIQLIGKKASKAIHQYFKGSIDSLLKAWEEMFNWTVLEDFGINKQSSMTKYYIKNKKEINELIKLFEFEEISEIDHDLTGKTYVITGKLNNYTRNELQKILENMGAKVLGSVSSKTTCLISNDIYSNSTKNKKAKEYGIPVISEENLIKELGLND